MKLKIYKHWSPRYFYDKFCQVLYDTINPGQPWFTRDSIRILDHYIKKADLGFEYGSGRSTIWFAKKSQNLISVEHDIKWYKKIVELIEKNYIKNVNLIHKTTKSPYIKSLDSYTDKSFDYVVVDGFWRMECALFSLKKIKPGGLLIIDDCQRYMPFKTRSPESIAEKQTKPLAKELMKKVSKWRILWTSDGVKNTSIFIKPF